jgi:type II secretory pathway pseudopilin PulG
MIGVDWHMANRLRQTVKRRKAFTVMEGIVVLAIFSMLATAFSEIYIRSSKSSMQTAERARVQADARTMLESITRAARVSNIDYTVYGGTLPSMASPAIELDLTDPDANAAYRIRINSNDAVGPTGCWGDGKSWPCLVVSTDGGNSWTQLSPKNSKVTSFGVFLYPSTDPFVVNQSTGSYSSNAAPLITVYLGLQGFALNSAENWTYSVQTTVTPRYYKR